jgi:hypothetical protein
VLQSLAWDNAESQPNKELITSPINKGLISIKSGLLGSKFGNVDVPRNIYKPL